jgi:hypothetical protein
VRWNVYTHQVDDILGSLLEGLNETPGQQEDADGVVGGTGIERVTSAV